MPTQNHRTDAATKASQSPTLDLRNRRKAEREAERAAKLARAEAEAAAPKPPFVPTPAPVEADEKHVRLRLRVVADRNIDDAEKVMIAALGTFAWNNATFVWPSNRTLAERCGWYTSGKRSGASKPAISKVKRVLVSMEEKGLLRRDVKQHQGHVKQSKGEPARVLALSHHIRPAQTAPKDSAQF